MYLLLGVIFLIIGAVMLFSPETFYEITQSWKNESASEPSDLFMLGTRFGGAAFLIVGILAFIVHFIQ